MRCSVIEKQSYIPVLFLYPSDAQTTSYFQELAKIIPLIKGASAILKLSQDQVSENVPGRALRSDHVSFCASQRLQVVFLPKTSLHLETSEKRGNRG